jgi:hypothetical protein
MRECTFQRSEDDPKRWICTQCGEPWVDRHGVGDTPAYRNCLPPKKLRLNLAREAAKKLEIPWRSVGCYMRALYRWAWSGFPVRTQQEVCAIATVCDPCSYNDVGTCELCGCKVNKRRLPLVNKRKMKTEDCPKGMWIDALSSLRTGEHPDA